MHNWRQISDGGVFESLVGSLLYAENPEMICFGRPGPDHGLDMITPDRKHVYQAKHHVDEKMRSAIDSGNKELKKIKESLDPSHKNYKWWKDVNQWTLVGNFLKNPEDLEKWEAEIVPAFWKMGIKADFLGEEELNVKLDRNPEIAQSYFKGGIRTLIYPRETYLHLLRTSASKSFFNAPFVGREATIDVVREFAKNENKRVLLIAGTYGAGKTRLLYESMLLIGEEGWRVLWGLPSAMAKSSAWFLSVNSSIKTCVFIDDPKDVTVLEAFVEQLSVAERQNWKLVITCSKERLRILSPDVTRASFYQQAELPPLTNNAIKEIVTGYQGVDTRVCHPESVAEIARGMPSLVCLLLEFSKGCQRMVLPTDGIALMNLFVQKCVDSLPEELRKYAYAILRWVSVWGTLCDVREGWGAARLKFVSEYVKTPVQEVIRILDLLSEVGLVDKWGSNVCRYRVQPALVRRHMIGSWLLCESDGQYKVGAEGKELIKLLLDNNIVVPDAEEIIGALPGVLESYLPSASEASGLMKPLFDHLFSLIEAGDSQEQSKIISMLEKIGRFSPESSLILINHIFNHPKPSAQYVDREDVLQGMASFLGGLAPYVRDLPSAKRLMGLLRCIYLEVPDTNDRFNRRRDEIGKSVSAVINNFRGLKIFPDVALNAVKDRLLKGELAKNPFEVFLATQMFVAERTEWEPASSRTIVFKRRPVEFGTQEWERAMFVRTLIHEALKKNGELVERECLWRLFRVEYQFAHNLMSGSVYAGNPETVVSAHVVVEEDLKFIEKMLQDESCKLSLRELQKMRKIWEWEVSYGKESPIKDSALRCETLFAGKLSFPFHILLDVLHKESRTLILSVVDMFRNAKNADELDVFVEQTLEYKLAQEDGDIRKVNGSPFEEVACGCVEAYKWKGVSPISDFTERCLKRLDDTHPISLAFSRVIIGNYFKRIKKELPSELYARRFVDVLAMVKTPNVFLASLYSRSASVFLGPLTSVELKAILAHKIENSRLVHILPPWVAVDRDCVLSRMEEIFSSEDCVSNGIGWMLGEFVQGLHWAVDAGDLSPNEVPMRWVFEWIARGAEAEHLLEDYSLKELAKVCVQKQGAKELLRFVTLLIARNQERHNVRWYCLLHDVEYGLWFDIDKAEEFFKICHLSLEVDDYFAKIFIGKVVGSVDRGCTRIGTYISNYLMGRTNLTCDELCGLGRLLAHCEMTGDTNSAMRLICTRVLDFDEDKRRKVYCAMLPDEHGASWIGDKVPDEYLKKQEVAKGLFESEPEMSPLKEFYSYCLQRAEGTVSMVRSEIEELRHV